MKRYTADNVHIRTIYNIVILVWHMCSTTSVLAAYLAEENDAATVVDYLRQQYP